MPIEELLGLRGNAVTVCLHAAVGLMLVLLGVGVFISMPQLPLRIGSSVKQLSLWPWLSGSVDVPGIQRDSDIDMMFTPVIQSVDALLVLQGFGLGALVLVLAACTNSVSRSLVLVAVDTILMLQWLRLFPRVLFSWLVRIGSLPVDIRLCELRVIPWLVQ